VVLYCWFGDAQISIAQTRGCFTFSTDSIGCIPLKVDFRNCYFPTPPGPVAYNFDYAANPGVSGFATVGSPTGDTTFTYGASGIFEIRQVASGSSLSQAVRRSVKVFGQNSKPFFSLTSCAGLVRVKLIDSIFRQCRVEIQNQARVIDIEKGGTTIDFPVAVTSPTRLAVRVTGTSPTNCGNTLSIDSITVYPSLPSLPILFAEGLNPTSLLIS
jgi:hypothetical protein